MAPSNPENRKKSKKKKKPGFVTRFIAGLIKFSIDIWSGDLSEAKKWKRSLQRFVKFMAATFRKFMSDEAVFRGTSISYSLVVSFVPTLIVGLLLGARFINTEEYFSIAKEFVRKNGIPLDLEPYFDIIRELLQNAAAIGGIGFIIMLFSATSVLRNIESALNAIWRVHRNRPFMQRIAGYIMVMLFGPVVLTLGITYAQWMLDQFVSPDMNRIAISEGKAVAMGDKHVYIRRQKDNSWKFHRILTEVDFDYENETFIISEEGDQFLSDERRGTFDNKIRPVTYTSLLDAGFTGYVKKGDKAWIITDTGTILHTRDGGIVWHVKNFVRARVNLIFSVRFYDIHMINSNEGFIIGSNGIILRTENGRTWQPVKNTGSNAALREIIPLAGGRFAAVGDDFSAVISSTGEDGEIYFREWQAVTGLVEEKKFRLTGIAMQGQRGWICGESGTLLTTDDGGDSWSKRTMSVTFDFRDVEMATQDLALLAGDSGLLRYSHRAGDSLQWIDAGSPVDNNLTDIEYEESSGTFYLVGDDYHILGAKASSLRKKESTAFEILQKSPIWRKVVAAIGNVILPFLVIWMLFFLVYKAIPYTHVKLKAASIGAATTSILWVIFLLIFKFYISSFSKGTFAIYGTLAAIPLGLLLIYISALIMLYGSEVAFLVQYPGMVNITVSGDRRESEKRQIWYGLQVLHRLAANFYNNKGPVPEKELVKICNSDQEEFIFIITKLKDRGFVVRSEDEDSWILASDPANMKMTTLMEDLDPSDYMIPGYHDRNQFMKQVKKIFDELQKNRDQVIQNMTFADFLSRYRK